MNFKHLQSHAGVHEKVSGGTEVASWTREQSYQEREPMAVAHIRGETLVLS